MVCRHARLLRQVFSILTFLTFVGSAFAIDVKLAWDANTETDLAGYKVYYGTASRTYGIPLDAKKVTTYTVTGLNAGTYYFAVTAYNAGGLESGYSNEVVATLACTYSIAPTSQTFDQNFGTGTIAVTAAAGCGWTATSGADWITITSGASGTGNGIVTYSIAANAASGARTGTLSVAGQTFTVTQTGISCSYTLSPPNQAVGSAAQTGGFGVIASSGCTWTAVSNVPWMVITAGSSGNGNGTVNYSVFENTSAASRVGTISVAGQTYTLTQGGVGCASTISPTSQSFTEAAGTGSITVTAGAGCSWSATTNTGWITITSGTSGSGNGTVGYSVSANTSTSARTGTVLVAGQTFTVNQSALSCTYSLSPASQAMTAAGGSGGVDVTAGNGCTWTYTNNASWLTITGVVNPAGGGKGRVNYSASANTSTSSRTGTITIAGQTFTVTQAGIACTYTIVPTGKTFSDVGGSDTVSLTTGASCNWTATSSAAWLAVSFGGSGSGNGTIGYSVGANTSTDSRTATLTIGGQVFTVTQTGISCSYAISPTSQSLTEAAGTHNVAVTAPDGCSWTAVSGTNWISIISGGSGVGSGTVAYSVAANTSTRSRTATLTVAGQTFTVTQAGLACAYSLSPASQSFSDGAGNGIVNVTAGSGCQWTAISGASWITINSGNSGLGSGPVGYSITANNSTSSRTGNLTIAGQTFTVTQAGIACTYAISPTSQSFASGGAVGSVVISAPGGCNWTATSNTNWIQITSGSTGSGGGSLEYSVAANTELVARTGTLTIAGRTFTVTQAGFTCTYTLTPTSQSVVSSASTSSITVSAAGGCAWTAVSNVSWVSITSGASGTGNGNVGYSVEANASGTLRTGTLTIAGQSFAVTQAGAGCAYSILPSNRAVGDAAGTGTVAVTATPDCSWNASSNANWVTITAGGAGTGSGTVGYSFSANTSAGSRSGTMTIAGQSFTLTQAAVSCTFSVTPVALSFTDAGGSSSMQVAAQPTCGWTATSNAPWLTITSGAGGTGPGTVVAAATANSATDSRTGTLTVAGQTIAVTQAGVNCTYSITPAISSVPQAAATGSVAVTAPSACAWTATSNAGWIAISSGGTGSGNGAVNYLVTANATTASRTGTLAIAGRTFTLTQDGLNCSYAISPTAQSVSDSATSGSVAVTATSGCPWIAASNADWITVDSGRSGAGNGAVSYSVSANTSTNSRTGTLTVAGQTFSVTQGGITCQFSISPAERSHSDVASIGSVAVTTAAGCAWTAASNATWITLSSGNAGNGPGTVTYRVEANTTTIPRTGAVTIAGKNFTVTQSGLTCSYALSEYSHSYTNAAGTGSVAITAANGCGWSVTNSAAWITITSGSSGSGNGIVQYAVEANTGTSSRTAAITIGGQVLTVSQSAFACTSTISPASQSFSSTAGSGSVTVTSSGGCSWTAVSNANWITISSGSTGSGNGSVNYLVTANTGTATRTGTLTIAGQTFSVTQATASCTYSISPSSQSVNDAATTGTVAVTYTPGCTWTATSNASWLTVSFIDLGGGASSGKGTVTYAVAANTGGSSRAGTITIAGQTFTVTQGSVACKYSISPTIATFSEAPSTGSVSVSCPSGCSWTATSDVSWIRINYILFGNGGGDGTVNYSVSSNSTFLSRTGTLTIAGQTLTVTQAGICNYETSATSQSFSDQGGTGSVAVKATPKCTWSAQTTDDWISITSGSSGVGNGTVEFAVAANTSLTSRRGTIIVAGTIFYIVQEGFTCAYTLSPASQAFPDGGGTGEFSVITADTCAWTAASDSSWITVTSDSSGKGIGTVKFSISANTAPEARTGIITVDDQTFSVSQEGFTCKYTISPSSQSFTEKSGAGSILLSTTSTCTWTVTTDSSWITITSASAGTGNGTVDYSVAANASTVSRAGKIRIENQEFTVLQSGVPCNYSILPGSQSFAEGAGTGSIKVSATAGCSWVATSDADWITITYGSSGSGNGTIEYSVAANNSTDMRIGTISVGGQAFTVTQATAACTYAISPVSESFEQTGGIGTVSVVATEGCPWTSASNASWISISDGARGSGNGTVAYSVAANPDQNFRVSTMAIAGQAFTIAQTNSTCAFSVSPPNQTFSTGGGSGSVTVSAGSGCTWKAESNADWIAITSGAAGIGTGTVTFSVGPSEAISRAGTATIAGQVLSVIQSPQFTYNFPQFAKGPDWASTLVVTNPSRTEIARGTISFFDNDGQPQALSVNGEAPATNLQFTVLPLGSSFFTAAPSSTMAMGSAQMVTDIPVGGIVQFVHPSLRRTGVPDSAASQGALALAERSASHNKNTELSFSNPDAATLGLSLSLRGLDGVQVPGGSAVLTLPARGSTAKSLEAIFPDADTSEFRGTVSVTPSPDGRVSVISLLTGVEAGQFAALPVVEIYPPPSTTHLYFAHFVNGAEWSSALYLANPLGLAGNGTIAYLDDFGNRISNATGNRVSSVDVFQNIQSLGAAIIPAEGQGRLVTGSTKVTATSALGGVLTFTSPYLGMAAVPASLPMQAFIIPASRSADGTLRTGVAIASAGSPVSVVLTLRDQAGQIVDGGQMTFDLPANGHLSRYVEQLFPNAATLAFQGTLTATATGGNIVGTALLLGVNKGEISALPVSAIR